MKMTVEDYNKVKTEFIKVMPTIKLRKPYKEMEPGDQKQYRFRVLFATLFDPDDINTLHLNKLYTYLDDNHVDTALRKILREVS